MPVIDLSGLQTALGAPEPILSGYVKATYWAGGGPVTRVDGAEVVFPTPIRVALVDGAPVVPLDLPATDGSCCVEWEIYGGSRFTRYTTIPATPAAFGDLPVVDPSTFLPLDPVPPSAQDVLQEAQAAIGSAADAAASAASAAASAAAVSTTRALRNFLLPGEVLPSDGVMDASPILQRALDASAGSAFGPLHVAVPEGRYRLNTALSPRSGVGIVGAGRDLTVFAPTGVQPFMLGPVQSTEPPGGWTFLDDMLFADFTVDCSEQTAPAYQFGIKAFYMQNVRRARFQRISCVGSFASMFGLDFVIDTEFVDCTGTGSGRGGPPTRFSTGSTFAFGVGRFADESIRLVNCTARGAAAAGFYFERLEGRGAYLTVPGFSMVGCAATGCQLGVNDAGTGGITATGCDFSSNAFEGWVASSGGQSSVGGTNGSILGCTITGNADGVVFAGNGAGGYTITGGTLIADNPGDGVVIRAGATLDPAGIRVQGAVIRGNGTGFHVEAGLAGRAPALTIDGCAFDKNTVGVYLESGALAPTITGNSFTGLSGACVKVTPGLPIDTLVIERNRWYDQAVPLVGTGGYDQARIRDNLSISTIAYALRQIVGADPAARAQGGPLGATIPADQPITMYTVVTGAPAASSWVRLYSPDGVIRLGVGRNSAGTAWTAHGSNATGGAAYASVTAATGPRVLAVVRDTAGVRLHPRGLTQAVTAIPTLPAVSIDRSTITGTGFATTLVYAGAHDDTMRTAVMNALATEYGIT